MAPTTVYFIPNTHIGWMLTTPKIKPGEADVRDLRKNKVVAWQHEWYFSLALLYGIALPWLAAGFLWNDWRGGLFYACFARITFVHHVSLLVEYLY